MTRLISFCLGTALCLWIPLAGMAVETESVSGLLLHDPSTGLVWARNGNLAGTELNWQAAQRFVVDLNQQAYAGARNWRLPTRNELETLFALIRDSGIAEKPTNVQDDFYWSATIPPLETGYALAVSLEDGSKDEQVKGEFNYVWPVY